MVKKIDPFPKAPDFAVGPEGSAAKDSKAQRAQGATLLPKPPELAAPKLEPRAAPIALDQISQNLASTQDINVVKGLVDSIAKQGDSRLTLDQVMAHDSDQIARFGKALSATKAKLEGGLGWFDSDGKTRIAWLNETIPEIEKASQKKLEQERFAKKFQTESALRNQRSEQEHQAIADGIRRGGRPERAGVSHDPLERFLGATQAGGDALHAKGLAESAVNALLVDFKRGTVGPQQLREMTTQIAERLDAFEEAHSTGDDADAEGDVAASSLQRTLQAVHDALNAYPAEQHALAAQFGLRSEGQTTHRIAQVGLSPERRISERADTLAQLVRGAKGDLSGLMPALLDDAALSTSDVRQIFDQAALQLASSHPAAAKQLWRLEHNLELVDQSSGGKDVMEHLAHEMNAARNTTPPQRESKAPEPSLRSSLGESDSPLSVSSDDEDGQ